MDDHVVTVRILAGYIQCQKVCGDDDVTCTHLARIQDGKRGWLCRCCYHSDVDPTSCGVDAMFGDCGCLYDCDGEELGTPMSARM